VLALDGTERVAPVPRGTRAAVSGAMIATDIMTENPRTVQATDPLSQAVEVLQSLNVRHLPVVDDRGHLIGMLSDRDLGPLLRSFPGDAAAERMVVPLSERPVAELMSSGAVAVERDADVTEIIGLMLEEHVGAVPVVDGADNVVGIVSYVDVLRTLHARSEPEEEAKGQESGASPEPLPSPPRERPAPRAYDARPWAGGWGVFVGDTSVVGEPLRAAADAVAHAKDLARHSAGGAQIRVIDGSGTLVSEFFYLDEERAALERDGTVPSIAASRPARRKRPRSGV
jgi:CBS domain-containing membrane protein